jgi:hypothetical protein
MQNVLKIINLFGGLEKLRHLRIEGQSKSLMPLVIERIGTGPRGLPLVSVAHYHTQNGDAMTDPEITFEIGADPTATWLPVTFQQDNLGIYQEAVRVRGGQVYMNDTLVRSISSFAHTTWDPNVGAQGYVETAARMVAEQRDPYASETPLGIALDDNPVED